MDVEHRDLCPVCGSASSTELLSLPFAEAPVADYLRRHYSGRLDPAELGAASYVLDACDDCGLIFQREVLTLSSLRVLYGELAAHDRAAVESRRGLDVRTEYAGQVEQLIRLTGAEPSELSALDFGAGLGMWLDMAAGFGCRVAGCELEGPASAGVEASRHATLTLGELEPSSFDIVNAEQVVEHLVDPAGVLERLARSLRPGGVLRVAVPDGTGLRGRLGSIDWSAPKGAAASVEPVAPLEHINCFDRPSLLRLGRDAGLEPCSVPLRVLRRRSVRLNELVRAVRERVRPLPTVQLFRRP